MINEKSTSSSDKLSGKSKLGDLILDIGASHHMTGDISFLINTTSIVPCPIGFADGNKTYATHTGQFPLTDRITLDHALFVLNLNCSLISVSKLLKQTHCFALLTDTICLLQDRFTRTLIGAGKERGGVYYFTDVMAARVHRVSSPVATSADQLRWHQRLGHLSSSVLSVVPMFSSNKLATLSPCDTCYRAKQTREVFYGSMNKSNECFALIHCDVWGPYRTPASCGSVYFLTVVDDHSRAVWTYLMREKSEVRVVLQNFRKMTEKQFGKSVKMVRSDNGTEFMCLSQFFKENGVLHETSCVGTPQQNGRVERKHRHILNVARALLFQGSLPTKFWGEAVMTATHLINRTPMKVIKGSSPYQVLYGEEPQYNHLRVFGSLCYTHLRSRDKDKFGSRSRKCIFVGYPFGQKGWKVYDVDKKEFLISRDVVFYEDKFPWAHLSEALSVQSVPLIPTDYSNSDWLFESTPVFPERGSTTEVDCSVPTCVDLPVVNDVAPHVIQPLQNFETQVEPTTVSPTETQTGFETVISTLPVSESVQEPSPVDPILLGRGQRVRVPSVKLKDYVNYNALLSEDTPRSSLCFVFVLGKHSRYNSVSLS